MKLQFLAAVLVPLQLVASFHVPLSQRARTTKRDVPGVTHGRWLRTMTTTTLLRSVEKAEDGEAKKQEYRNAATMVLSNFMAKDDVTEKNPLAGIDFDAPKVTKLPLATLAQALDAELYVSEWFVTGRVNPIYFADTFRFQDPDVKLSGIQAYAAGVNKLFDQSTARAEIISTTVNPDKENTITCTWRLSGKVDIGPGLTIKPYIVYTDFTVDDATGLIVLQEDRFDLPQWDILLSALFPFLIGKVTAAPAPALGPRNPPPSMPQLSGRGNTKASPFDALQDMFGGLNKKQ